MKDVWIDRQTDRQKFSVFWGQMSPFGVTAHRGINDICRDVKYDLGVGNQDDDDDDDGLGLNYKVLDMSTQIAGQNNIQCTEYDLLCFEILSSK